MLNKGKKVGILQSNYIPWKGYFNLIDYCDEFILYDDVQYTRRDWRNRNKIKSNNGLKWLTISVEVKGKYHQTIRETKVVSQDWARRHWQILVSTYSTTEFFSIYAPFFKKCYEEASDLMYLSDINKLFILRICQLLEIKTKISSSDEFELVDGRTERLLQLCCDTNASCYLSGPAAKSYLDPKLFEEKGIGVEWMEYDGYPKYRQLHGNFEHGVTILDLIFNCGPKSIEYVRRNRFKP